MADGKSYDRARVMRRALTPPEATLWAQLKGKGLEGFRFRRQHPIGPYVLDFYCAAARLAVEVDGLIHGDPDQARHDAYRDGWLGRQGISVLRIPATEVRHQLEGVMALLLHTLRERREGG